MRALIVSYLYAPIVSPRAFRWAAIAEHWAHRGHQIDVVCAGGVGLAPREVLRGVEVHRVGVDVARAVRATVQEAAWRAGGPDTAPPGRGWLAARSWVASAVRWVHGRTWKGIYWPDYACWWYVPAVRRGAHLLATRRYDALITVSIPFTSHVVGLTLKRRCSHVRWVVDIGDPFSFSDLAPQNNHPLYGRLNRYAERAVVRRADAIAVTAEPARACYAALFPESAPKAHVIPPLFSPAHGEPEGKPVFPADGKVRLVFVGTLYRRIRDPRFLLRVFARLLDTPLRSRVELHFFGSVHDCEEYFAPYRQLVGTKIFLHGLVSHAVALRAMRDAGVLLNIGNRTSYQLPSKIVEYVHSGRAIVSFAKTDQDASAALLRAYPASLCLPEDDAVLDGAQFARLLQFIEAPPSVDAEALAGWLSAFEAPAVVAAYEALLTQDTQVRIPPTARAGGPRVRSRSPVAGPRERSRPAVRIAIDGTAPVVGGGLTYLRELVPALCAASPDDVFYLFLRSDMGGLETPLPPTCTRILVRFPRCLQVMWRVAWQQFVFPVSLLRIRADALLSPYDLTPLLAPCRVVLGIQNANPYAGPPAGTWLGRRRNQVRRWLAAASARRARRVFFVSEWAREAIGRRLRVPVEKSCVVYHGVSRHLRPADRKPAWRAEHPYVLAVSSVSAHKDYVTLVKAWPHLQRLAHEEVRLIIVGPVLEPAYDGQVWSTVARLGLEHTVSFVREVTQEQMCGLYQGAAALVMASHVETFGLPMVEAMACGVPVVASDIPVAHEVCGDSALYYRPGDAADLAAKLHRVLTDTAARVAMSQTGRERAGRFSWPAAADLTLRLLKEDARRGARGRVTRSTPRQA